MDVWLFLLFCFYQQQANETPFTILFLHVPLPYSLL